MATWLPQKRNYAAPPPTAPDPAALAMAQATYGEAGPNNFAGIDVPSTGGTMAPQPRNTPGPGGMVPAKPGESWDPYALSSTPPPGSGGQGGANDPFSGARSRWSDSYSHYYDQHGGYQGYVDRQAHRTLHPQNAASTVGIPGGGALSGLAGPSATLSTPVLQDIARRQMILQQALRSRRSQTRRM